MVLRDNSDTAEREAELTNLRIVMAGDSDVAVQCALTSDHMSPTTTTTSLNYASLEPSNPK